MEIKEIFIFKDLIKSLTKVLNNNSFPLLKELFNAIYYSTKCIKKQGGDYLKREWLIAFRKAKGLTQKELAEAIGVSQISLSTYEQGIRTPKPQVAKKIARVLGFEWTKFYED